MTVTVKRLGGSMTVVIPVAIAREMDLSEGTALDVTTTADAIVMRRPGRRARRPIGAIVTAMNAAHYRRRRRELSGDRPVGKEAW